MLSRSGQAAAELRRADRAGHADPRNAASGRNRSISMASTCRRGQAWALLTQPISCIGLPVCDGAHLARAGRRCALPIGVQLIAAPWREDDCLGAAGRWNWPASRRHARPDRASAGTTAVHLPVPPRSLASQSCLAVLPRSLTSQPHLTAFTSRPSPRGLSTHPSDKALPRPCVPVRRGPGCPPGRAATPPAMPCRLPHT